MSSEVELLTEIRDLLLVMAEPSLAKRDAALRSALRAVVGKSEKKAKATLIMDGTLSQSDIVRETGIDRGNLSRLVSALAKEQLISADDQHPRLMVNVPPTFFDEDNANE